MTITLAFLDQEVARRTGPYFQAAQDSSVPTTSTTIAAYMPTLKTSALLGGPENLWLLRRGVHLDGTPISGANYNDRTRMVQSFDAAAGRVVVDRNWGTPMVPNELAEFTHLHPDQELRPAVLAGLRRCFIADTIPISATGSYGTVDVTHFAPWVTNPNQVVRVEYGTWQPVGALPFQARINQGHVLLTAPVYNSAWVTTLRPAWARINGVDSDHWPANDSDVLDVDLDYAASAGHIEAWRLFPSRMFAAAAGNLQATQDMAAREFTRQALLWGPSPTRDIGFSEVVRLPAVRH